MKRILVIPDCHVPCHDARAYGLMVKAGRIFRPTDIVIMGDYADCYSISEWPKKPDRGMLLKDELGRVKRELSALRQTFKSADVVYLEGNHEYRGQRELMKNPAFFGMVSIRQHLGIDAMKFRWVEYGEHHRIGKLLFAHVGAGGKLFTANAVARYGHSLVVGHRHQFQTMVKVDYTGKCLGGYCCGWLGDFATAGEWLKGRGVNIADWQLGFATVLMKDDGKYFYRPHPIVGYECEFEGRIIK